MSLPFEIKPYYQDDLVTLYNADCLDHPDVWIDANVLVTDPPYGINWHIPARRGRREIIAIKNDDNTRYRDAVISLWGELKPAVVFGSPLKNIPKGTRQVLVWEKTLDTGVLGSVAGFRRNWEAIYLINSFGNKPGKDSSVLKSTRGVTSYAKNIGHSNAKPISLMERLIEHCPDGVVADPFAGSGSTLVAARNLGRQAIGFEIDEKYCEIAARRLSQMVFDLGQVAS